jgi:hypothetical protein
LTAVQRTTAHLKPQFFQKNPNVGDTTHLEDSRSKLLLKLLPLRLAIEFFF